LLGLSQKICRVGPGGLLVLLLTRRANDVEGLVECLVDEEVLLV